MAKRGTKKSIHFGAREIHEVALPGMGVENELWHATSFRTPFNFHNESPPSHDTLLLISEGPLGRIFGLDGA
jgi:hypothetical protein